MVRLAALQSARISVKLEARSNHRPPVPQTGYLWEKWAVFLHPSQPALVERSLFRTGASLRFGGNGQDYRGPTPRGPSRPRKPAGACAADDFLEGARERIARPACNVQRPANTLGRVKL